MTKKHFKILIINPGSTSSKLAVYTDDTLDYSSILSHSPEDKNLEQRSAKNLYIERKALILEDLENHNIDLHSLDAVVARGGLLAPIEGGVYRIGPKMVEDLASSRYGDHACNIGGVIAYELATELGCEALTVDPVVVDELKEVSRISGSPYVQRKSIFHALSHRATARKGCSELGLKYEEANVIVAHLGGGITVGIHSHGKIIDINNGLEGDGAFSPERSGSLPAEIVAHLCYTLPKEEVKLLLRGKGGLAGYLGTSNLMEVVEKIKSGDKYADLIHDAMSYQISKMIAEMSVAVCGDVDAIFITGGMSREQLLVERIIKRVDFIAPVKVYPGENEMQALKDGALRGLRGEELIKEYYGERPSNEISEGISSDKEVETNI